MTKKVERTMNTNDTATVDCISVNSSTAVTLVSANAGRMSFRATINGQDNDRTVFIRYYAASVDNIKQGNVITKKLDEDGSFFRIEDIMDVDNVYTGEISAILLSGGSINVYITEY